MLHRRLRYLGWVALIALSLAFVALYLRNFGIRIDELEHRGDAYAAAAAENAVQAELNAEAANRLARQVDRLGGSPVVEPPLPDVDAPIIGPRGPQGPRGLPGVDGRDGKDGRAGSAGRDGQAGESITGPPGPVGPPGESVVGPPGPAGPAGQDGQDGQPGYPQSFTFTYSLGQTYTCTDDDGDRAYTCTQQETP